MAAPLVALTGLAVDVAPVARRVHIVTHALSADTSPSIAADLAIRRRAAFLALPRTDVTLELAFVAMPTSFAVTVSTETLAVASAHLPGLLVDALAVVAFAVLPGDQAPPIRVAAHAAATVAGAFVGADDPLRIPAELPALAFGQGTVFLVLTGLP